MFFSFCALRRCIPYFQYLSLLANSDSRLVIPLVTIRFMSEPPRYLSFWFRFREYSMERGGKT